jgi:hypothetical protein
MGTIEHTDRALAFREQEEKRALQRAHAILDLVSTLAQARTHVTDKDLQTRISAALLNAHIALSGFVPMDLPESVTPIVQKRA